MFVCHTYFVGVPFLTVLDKQYIDKVISDQGPDIEDEEWTKMVMWQIMLKLSRYLCIEMQSAVTQMYRCMDS